MRYEIIIGEMRYIYKTFEDMQRAVLSTDPNALFKYAYAVINDVS